MSLFLYADLFFRVQWSFSFLLMSFIDQNNNFSFLIVKGCQFPTYKVLGIIFIFDLKKVIGIYIILMLHLDGELEMVNK